MTAPTVRLSVNLDAASAAQLKQLANDRGATFTETIRRAISVYHFIDGEHRNGSRILIENGGDAKEMVLL
jgi:hypothetical protein